MSEVNSPSKASSTVNTSPLGRSALVTDGSKAMTLFVMVVATLYFGKEVLIPVTLALLLAFILAPLIAFLRRLHLGRVPSVLLGVFLALAVITAIGGVIGSQIAQLSTGLPQYVSTVETKISDARAYTLGRLTSITDRIGRKDLGIVDPQPTPATQSNVSPAPSASDGKVAGIAKDAASPMELATRYLSPILSPLATLGIVLVVCIFASLQREDLRDRLIRLLGANDLHNATLAIDDASQRLNRYFITQLSINSAFGVAIGIGLLIIGVPNPVLWAILSALLRFIPYVGSIISAVLPVALAAAVEPGWSMTIATAILYVCAEGLTGQAIEPLVYGHSTGLSPFSVVVAAIFWTWVWGPIGLILSTPLTLCLVVLGRHLKRLEFLDVLLGDRPVLTPAESFYQRVLAGDAEEIQDHAESLLKEHSLAVYYDQIALKGLKMAASAVERGNFSKAQIEQMVLTIQALASGVPLHARTPLKSEASTGSSGNAASKPEAPRDIIRSAVVELGHFREGWEDTHAATIVAGRGLLDVGVAALLLELLKSCGMNGQVVDSRKLSREQIASFDMTGVKVLCVCMLDPSSSPDYLRFLIERVRGKLGPGVPVLLAFGPQEASAVKEFKSKMNADHLVHSVENTVTTCLQIAAAGKP